jgi:hypothetical protein
MIRTTAGTESDSVEVVKSGIQPAAFFLLDCYVLGLTPASALSPREVPSLLDRSWTEKFSRRPGRCGWDARPAACPGRVLE